MTDALDTIHAPNGTTPQETRIRFGPRPSQVLPASWAEVMLTELKRINPALFGKLLTKASDEAK